MDERLVQFSEANPRSKLAKMAGRESQLSSSAMLGAGPPSHKSRGHYKSLYKVDIKKELEEWDLPFAAARTRPTGAVLSNTKLPPISSEPAESEEESKGEPEEFDVRALQQMLGAQKESGSLGTKAQHTLFVDRESYIFKELKKICTGEDAISFFAKNGNTTPVKFLYCNKANEDRTNFRPYDLVVVPEKEINPEYYSISAQGVVHVQPKSRGEGSATTFYSLADWMHQSKMFNLLSSMKFFKHYLYGKIFKLWRGNVRYRHYCTTREKLKRNLFYAIPVFIESIPRTNELLYKMTTRSLLELKDSKPVDIGNYAEQQRDERAEAKKEFEDIMQKLITSVEEVFQHVKESADIPELEDLDPAKLGQRNKKKSMVEQRREQEQRKHKSMLAQLHNKMCDPYVRLLDYKVIETLVTLIRDKVTSFYENMMEKKTRIFISTVSYGKRAILFHPNEDDFKEALESMIDSTIMD